MIKDVSFRRKSGRCSIAWNVLPWKFEAGTPSAGDAVGLMEAVRYLKRLGMENVKRHEEKLTAYTLSRMQECSEKVEVYGPTDSSLKCGIIPFGVKSLSSHDIALFLDSFGIMVRSGFHCAQPLHEVFGINSSARASFYIYNTCEEIDRFVEVLKEIGQF